MTVPKKPTLRISNSPPTRRLAHKEDIPKLAVRAFVEILLESCDTDGMADELANAVRLDADFYAQVLAEALAE
jgi:hypothetical protein